MYALYVGIGFLLVLAFLLVQFKPAAGAGVGAEHFTIAAVHPTLSPACTDRNADAQKLLARFAQVPETDADASELRLLLSKLCCMDADITSPAAGLIRTQPLQFRTSTDMDVASSIVGRCHAKALQDRDVDLILEKFSKRGHELVSHLCVGADAVAAAAELDAVLSRLRWAMTNFCRQERPHMDRPVGPRDPGFWEPEETADLSQYQGISAAPKA